MLHSTMLTVVACDGHEDRCVEVRKLTRSAQLGIARHPYKRAKMRSPNELRLIDAGAVELSSGEIPIAAAPL